jgi:hypothetical protein
MIAFYGGETPPWYGINGTDYGYIPAEKWIIQTNGQFFESN